MYLFENTEKGNKRVKHTKKKIVRSKCDYVFLKYTNGKRFFVFYWKLDIDIYKK